MPRFVDGGGGGADSGPWGEIPERLWDAVESQDSNEMNRWFRELDRAFTQVFRRRAVPQNRELAEEAAIVATLRVFQVVSSGKLQRATFRGLLNSLAFGSERYPSVLEEHLQRERRGVGLTSIEEMELGARTGSGEAGLVDGEGSVQAQALVWIEALERLRAAEVRAEQLPQGRLYDTVQVVLRWVRSKMNLNRREGSGPEVVLLTGAQRVVPKAGVGEDPQIPGRRRAEPELLTCLEQDLNVSRGYARKLLDRTVPYLEAWGLLPQAQTVSRPCARPEGRK
ncbi:MAG: hypothetical protein FJX77_09620 [Armatimonadetes bacterium]|nr:hypothetical protein [Armatimonadota bacterium]